MPTNKNCGCGRNGHNFMNHGEPMYADWHKPVPQPDLLNKGRVDEQEKKK